MKNTRVCVWTDTVDTKKPLHKSKGCEVVAQRHSCHVCVATSVCIITIVPNNNNKINNNSKNISTVTTDCHRGHFKFERV